MATKDTTTWKGKMDWKEIMAYASVFWHLLLHHVALAYVTS
jgi:hypothetical protein